MRDGGGGGKGGLGVTVHCTVKRSSFSNFPHRYVDSDCFFSWPAAFLTAGKLNS